MYKTNTYDEPKKSLANYAEVENSEVHNDDYEDPIYENTHDKVKKKKEKEKQNDDESKSLPKYKHKFAISPKKRKGTDKDKYFSIKFQGIIYSNYKISKGKDIGEQEDKNKLEPEHHITECLFERDYLKSQMAFAAKTEKAKLIDFGSGIVAEVGHTFFKVDSDGKFQKPVLEIQAKGRISSSSEDGPIKQMLIQAYGQKLFKQGSVVDIVVKVEIDTTKATKELIEATNKYKRRAKELEDEANKIKNKAEELRKKRELKRDKFVKEQIEDYQKRNKKLPSKGKIEKFVEKFYRTDTNKNLQKQIKSLRKKAGDIKGELKKIQKLLTKKLGKVVGILDGPIIRATLKVVGRILTVVGIIFDVIGAIIVAWQLANDIMNYGIRFGFNPKAILGLDDKGPGYDNPPLYVKGDGENVESEEPVHNEPFNFILESGDGEKEGSGNDKGNIEGGTGDSPEGTVKNGKTSDSRNNGTVGGDKKGTGTNKTSGLTTEKVNVGTGEKTISGGVKTEAIVQEGKGVKVETKSIKISQIIEGEEFDGVTRVIGNKRIKLNKTSIIHGEEVVFSMAFTAYFKGELCEFKVPMISGLIHIDSPAKDKKQKIRVIVNESVTCLFDGGKLCIKKGSSIEITEMK